MFCKQCGADNPSGAAVCSKCGQPTGAPSQAGVARTMLGLPANAAEAGGQPAAGGAGAFGGAGAPGAPPPAGAPPVSGGTTPGALAAAPAGGVGAPPPGPPPAGPPNGPPPGAPVAPAEGDAPAEVPMQGTPLADDGRDTSEESNNPTLYMAQAAELPLAGQLTPPDKLALEQAGGPSWGQANAAGGTPAAGGNTPQNVVMDMDDEPPPKKKRGCLIFIIIVLILIVLLLAGSTVAYFVIGVDRIYEMAGMSTTDTPVVALPDGGVYAIPTLPDGGTIAIPTVPGVPTPLVPGVAIPVPTLGDAAVAIPPVGDAAVALATGDAAAAPAEADAGAPPAETPPAETPPAETPPAETPPAETPPVETPPAETPPTEATDDGQPRTPERYISRAQSRLRRVGRPCLGRSSASGRVTLTVSLLQNGTVSRASVSGNSTGDSNLGRCLSGAVLNQRLGIPPRGTHSFQVTFSR